MNRLQSQRAVDDGGPRVVGLGEVLWDEFADGRRPGGAPANVAVQAAQLGANAYIVSSVGEDEAGAALVSELEARGVHVSSIQRDRRYPTGRVTVEHDDRGEPRYTIHENAAWDHLQDLESVRDLAASADAICFGSLAQRSPVSERCIHNALACAEGALRVFDVNLRQSWYTPRRIQRSLRMADVVKLNEAECHALAAPLSGRALDVASFSEWLRDTFELRVVLVTRGGDGCRVVCDEGAMELPSYPVTVVDPVGAGDAFTAGFVWAALSGQSARDSARFANRVGGLVAAEAGAMPKLRSVYESLGESFVPS